MSRVGVFGGSFNPIHFGHLLVADEVCERLGLDRVLFVPAARPPHKPAADLAPAHHRFQMTALAVREHPRFEVCDVEIERSGPSYTVDTLATLADRGDLYLLIGSETFLDLPNWREPETVARRARLVVVPRRDSGFDLDMPAAQKVLALLGLARFAVPDDVGVSETAARETSESGPRSPLLVHAASLPISGSDLRKRAREGRSLAYRVPASVAAYIAAHGLYRAGV